MERFNVSSLVRDGAKQLKGKVIIALNTAWNLVNFRSGLIKALIAEGYEVVAVAPKDEFAPRLKFLGCRFISLPMDNQGTHPGRDLLLFFRFFLLLRRERPAVFLGYTVKPNVYGSVAASILGIPVINNIAGLGTLFIHESWRTRLVRRLYRFALSSSLKVFFQNQEDRALFVEGGLVRKEISDLVPGSGIDLKRFTYTPHIEKRKSNSIRFLLIARMLWDKGIGEYVEAARGLKNCYPGAEFCLIGFLDVQNPSAISHIKMDEWINEGVIQYLGATDDIRPFIIDSDCVVLPSYREGTPRALLESAAIGRPIITTDTVGCKEVVDHNENGLLCKVRNVRDLAEKMERMLLSTHEDRILMGKKGREKVERQFDEQLVIDKYLLTIADLALIG